MVIRNATPLDVSALVMLNRMVHSMHSTALPDIFSHDPSDIAVGTAFRVSMESKSSYWLLAEEGSILAFLNADFSLRAETWYANAHEICYLGGIVVAPNVRRKGIAKALLAELKKEAISRGVRRIELDVWSFNAEAKKAFTQLGFSLLRERMTIPTHEA